MSFEIILLLVIILGALVLFVSGVVPVDLTAILVMVALMVSGILSPSEAISGFSNEATITILALLIISVGLKNTGAVEQLGEQMGKLCGRNEWLTLLVIMLISAITSGFINTTAVVAVFIPIIFRISKKYKLNPAVLLVPLSFGSMVGGSSTMIGTSTNLLINSIAQENGLTEFSIFKPTMLGALLLMILIVYMLFVGRRILSKKRENVKVFDQEVDSKQYLTEITIPEDSELVGEAMAEADLVDSSGFSILAFARDRESTTDIDPETVLKSDDSLIIKTDVRQIVKLNANEDLRVRTNNVAENRGVANNERESELFEVLVAANSNLLDQRIRDVDFSNYYDAWPLAVKKRRIQSPERLLDHKISYGDILLMSGNSHQQEDQTRNAWITVQRFSPERLRSSLPRLDRMWTSLAIILAVILLAVFNVLPILVSAWAGVAAMFLTGCLTLKRAYDNVEWKVIFLLAGIIPLGTALTKTGADHMLANGIIELLGGTSIHWVVAALFLVTITFTGIVSNQATAVLLVPVAINLAASMNLPPEPLVMTILFGASSSFLTPVGYQTNAMIYGPGNYTFTDFIKVGGPLALIFCAVVSWLIPVIYA